MDSLGGVNTNLGFRQVHHITAVVTETAVRIATAPHPGGSNVQGIAASRRILLLHGPELDLPCNRQARIPRTDHGKGISPRQARNGKHTQNTEDHQHGDQLDQSEAFAQIYEPVTAVQLSISTVGTAFAVVAGV